MRVRSVEPGRGWQWIVDGFGLFRRNPVVWVTITVVLAVIWAASAMIPVIGALAVNVVAPVFLAGLMLACRALEQGGEIEVSHLFAGFRGDVKPLLVIGAAHAIGALVIFGVAFLIAGGSMLPAILSGRGMDMHLMLSAMTGVLLGLAVALVLYMPLLMLVWFAPVLVVFHKLAPLDAMKLSFQACWVNPLPGLVYSAAILVLWVLAAIPLLLGLLVLMPVLACSIYTSYQDMFDEAGPAPAPEQKNRLLD